MYFETKPLAACLWVREAVHRQPKNRTKTNNARRKNVPVKCFPGICVPFVITRAGVPRRRNEVKSKFKFPLRRGEMCIQ